MIQVGIPALLPPSCVIWGLLTTQQNEDKLSQDCYEG